jgi:hypothetical protein
MRKVIAVIILLGIAMPAAAQQPCGTGIPCRPPAWDLPSFPELISPTPLVIDGNANPAATNTPTLTMTPTPMMTSTAIATFTPFFDPAMIGEKVETIEAIFEGTAVPVMNASGTPESLQTQVAGIGENAKVFIGYARTIQASKTMGPFTPLATLLFSGLVIILLFKATTYIIPVALALFGLVRKIVNLILDFIPG